MILEVCKEPTDEMRVFIIKEFHAGYGSAKIAVKIAHKFKVRVPYSRVKRVLDENGLHRTHKEAHAVIKADNLKGSRGQ